MDTADRQWELEKIEKVGEGILEELSPADCVDAVNWGDLGVVEARFVTTKDDSFYEVLIEEASPDARGFASMVENLFADRGFDVFVVTEW